MVRCLGLLTACLVVLMSQSSADAGPGARIALRHLPPGKLSPALQAVADARRHGSRAAIATASANGITTTRGRVLAVLESARGRTAAAAAAARAIGGEVTGRSANLLEVRVDPARLGELAEDATVLRLRPPALHEGASVTGEGIQATNAGAWHTAGETGSGVKVAILDGGFAGHGSLLGADLPASVTTKFDLCDDPASTEHGTAVAEIVHDVAPAAQLHLICFDSEVDLAAAESYAHQQGISILVHAVGWFNTGRGDGTGPPGSPDAVVAQARQDGILWVNAAGNQALDHWRGSFAGASELMEPTALRVLAGGTACLALRWDAWPTTTHDFDLYLVENGNVVASSVADQGAGTLPPTEDLCLTNSSGSDRTLTVAIVRYNAPGFGGVLDLHALGDEVLLSPVAAGSIVEPASSPAAVAVGALCWNAGPAAGNVEPYSSNGPTVDGRHKPDLVAPVGVSTATYGPSTACTGSTGFAGTSAAAPHVAGVAALLLSKHPSWTVPQLQGALERGALNGARTGAQGVVPVPVIPQKDDKLGAGTARLHPPGGAGPLVVTRTAWVPVSNGYLCCPRDVFTVNADGTAYTRLTSDVATDSAPVYDPGGSQIVYASDGQLRRMGADGSANTVLTSSTHGPRGPRFSPDGTSIVVYGEQWPGTAYEEIFRVDASGGGEVRLTNNPDSDRHPAYSPDGSKIVFSWRDGSDFELATIDADDGDNLTVLTSNGADDVMPTFSPDGTRIVFDHNGPPYGLFSLALAGNAETQLTTVAADADPEYAPNGATIAFSRDESVYLMSSNGDNEVALWAQGEDPSWNPRGQLASPRSLEPPGVSGTPRVGGWLQATAGVWLGGLPLTVSYEWQQCDGAGATCTAIPGATDLAYRTTLADAGHTLRAVVSVANGGGSATSASAATAAVTQTLPLNIVLPTVAGTPAIGQTLGSTAGTWDGAATFTQVWLRCQPIGGICDPIPGQTSASYTVTSADGGHTLRTAVFAQSLPPVGGTTVASSLPTAVVPGGGGGGGGGGPADLTLTGRVAPASAPTGQPLTWYLDVEDRNRVLAVGAYVEVDLPTGVRYDGGSSDRGPGCAVTAPQRVRCDLDFLSGNSPVGHVVVRTTVTAAGELVLGARAGHGQQDLAPQDNSITLRANTPSPTPPTTDVPTPTPRGVTRIGTSGRNRLVGTRFADVLRGLAGEDTLLGLAGNDLLAGGRGSDRLAGGPGVDLLEAGAGDDTVSARDGTRDTIRCGAGRDTVAADRRDRVAGDCERVRRG